MGKVHAENVRRLGNVEVAAVVGSRPETARKFAESAGIPLATSNLQDVLNKKEIAAIIRRCFANFGRGMVELIYFMAHPSMIKAKVDLDGKEYLDKA